MATHRRAHYAQRGSAALSAVIDRALASPPTLPRREQPHAHDWQPTSIGRRFCGVCMIWEPEGQS